MRRIGTLMNPVKWQVDEFTTREEIAAGIGRFNVNTLPVVNLQGRFSGIIRSENLFDAVEQDALSDLQTMVGAGKDEHALSTVWTAIQKRHPWLQINLLTAFLAASVVGLFEHTIAQFTALAVLMPVVAGQSGNSGSQALAVTLRGLALREIGVNAWSRVMRKEMSAGLAERTRHRARYVAVGLHLEQITGTRAGDRSRDGRVDDDRRNRRRVHSDHDEPPRSGPRDQFDDRADDRHRRRRVSFRSSASRRCCRFFSSPKRKRRNRYGLRRFKGSGRARDHFRVDQ